MENYTCCFLGHRTVNETDELRTKLTDTVEKLITQENVDTFLFGSNSRFDRLCLELVTRLKEKYPRVKRIYVRAEFPCISDDYLAYLLKSYDDTYYPAQLHGAGRASYVERNYEMINNSTYCVVYYDNSRAPAARRSGTKIALDYALKKGKEIIPLCGTVPPVQVAATVSLRP